MSFFGRGNTIVGPLDYGFYLTRWKAQRHFARYAAIDYVHKATMRQIDREERKLWLLLALIALAPEIVMIGRVLLK